MLIIFSHKVQCQRMALSARDIYSYGEREKVEPIVIVNKKVICNELLSNVLRGIIHQSPYNISDDYILHNLEPVFSPQAVHEAQRILYKNFYTLFPDDPNDLGGAQIGAKEKEVKKRWFLQDIIEKMRVIADIDHDIEFCVPWDYKYIIISDEEKRVRDVIKEKDLEIDAKFAALEKVIELQNRATIMAVESVMKNAFDNVKDVIHEKTIDGISTPIFEDAEFYKGRAKSGYCYDQVSSYLGAAEGVGLKDCYTIPKYTHTVYDIQILNSLMLFCLFCFLARIVQRFLMMFSLNI